MERLEIDFKSYPQTVKLYNDKVLKGQMKTDNAMKWFVDNIAKKESVFESIKLQRMVNKVNSTIGINKITIKERKGDEQEV